MTGEKVEVVIDNLDMPKARDVFTHASLTMYVGGKVHAHVHPDVIAKLKARNIEHEVVE